MSAVLAMWRFPVIAPAAVALAGCGSTTAVTKTVTETTAVSAAEPTDLAAPNRRVEFGYIKSLERVGDRYEMRFDPASAVYAEFGAFVTGLVGPVEEILTEVGPA